MSNIFGGLTVEQLGNEWIEWFKTDRTQRFGQFVINRHMPTGTWIELFNERDPSKAFRMIVDHLNSLQNSPTQH